MKKDDIQDIKAKIQYYNERIEEAKKWIEWNQQQIKMLTEIVTDFEREYGDAGPPIRKPSICPYCD